MSNLSYSARKLLTNIADEAARSVDDERNDVVDGVFEAVVHDEKVELLCEALSQTRLAEEYREDVRNGKGDVDVQRPLRDAERSLRDALDARVQHVKDAELERLSSLGYFDEASP
jgi:hypothetical protein